MDLEEDQEVVIIGAGPGGYTAAIRLGQYGLEPVVVEEENVGGVCLNWGCIPTKTLYSTTEPLGMVESWSKRGVEVEGIDFDLGEVTDYQKEVVGKLTGGVEKLIESNGGKVIEGRAELLPGPEVRVEREAAEELHLSPENVVLATGSKPVELPGFPFPNEDVWNSRDAVFPERVPEKLVVLGAGVIGLEMGTIYRRLGAEVEVLEMQEEMLPEMNLNRRFQSYLGRALKGEGIEVHTETKAVEFRERDDEKAVLGEKGGETKEFPADTVLVAVGRRPALGAVSDGLGLETDADGSLSIDEDCLTSSDGIYAIGDAAGGPLLAHKASREGLVAAASIAGEDISNYRHVPSVVFSDPEYAEVGLSEEEAEERGFDPLLGRFPFRASGKALAMDETEGMVQLVVDGETDVILGGSVLGPNASDLIGEIGIAVEMKLTAKEVGETIHPHPTLSEAIMEAAENVHGKAIHTANR
ncbi:MAG: dihydrolipoyl dehydrogenase [Candidatus Bipolaricaulota bacterium]